MDSLEQLLTELKAEYGLTKPKQTSNLPKSDFLIDKLLAEVKADFAEIDAAEASVKQQELAQEKTRQEKINAQKISVLQSHIQEWLTNLDPLSSEGIWFEKFAENYPSKLAAAMEYLEDYKYD
jgi:hypothetical protein